MDKDDRLIVETPCKHGLFENHRVGGEPDKCIGDSASRRPASLADLVEVLKQEGAVEVEARKQLREGRFDWLMLAPKQGRYLVLPLGDTPK